MSFQQYPIPEKLLHSLSSIGFLSPTPIQRQALPQLFEGKDVIACSETGSGKTGAYLIPILTQLLENKNKRALVLVPTRELATQVTEFADSLIKNHKTLSSVKLVGGSDIRRQFKALQRKNNLIIATPGRLIDHLQRNTIQIHNVELLVLDEGDRMIDMGFLPQLKEILTYLPKKRQTSFFTATLDNRVKDLASKYLYKPYPLSVGKPSTPVKAIKQSVLKISEKEKAEALVDQLNTREGSVIIFFKTQRKTNLMCKHLRSYGFETAEIHGGLTQGQRNKAINNFRIGKARILCATDVAARGIDIPQIAHVINADIPMNHDDYVHRIGRTARNGKDGEALSFVTPEEITNWNRLAKKYSLNSIMLHEDKSQKAKLRAKFQKRFSQAKKNDSKNVSSKKNNSNKIKRKSPTKKKSASTTNRKKY